MRRLNVTCGILLLLATGCIPTGDERNPFWTLTETYGAIGGAGDSQDDGGGSAAQADVEFRQTVTITFSNNHESSQVETSLAAWVNAGSIRSADQQDELLRGGYVQLTSEVRLGTAYTLPPGTFVLGGPGLAGAAPVHLGCPNPEIGGGVGIPTTQALTLIAPDVLLVFSQPPVSCDSVAFVYVNELVGAATGPVTSEGGFKTLAQVNVYECTPLSPGLFLKTGGGVKAANEFFENNTIHIEFNETPDAQGNYAIVTILT